MPKIQFLLQTDRQRVIDDPVETFVLEGERQGFLREEHNIDPASKRFNVDAAPDKYSAQVEIEGFKDLRHRFQVKTTTPPGDVPIQLQHRCKVLPEFDQLETVQKQLLASSESGARGAAIWQRISENKAATFFQITHALLQTSISGQRMLAHCIESVRKMGGVEIEDTVIGDDTKTRTATGWRLHVVIKEPDRARIETILTTGSLFIREGFVHSTHKKFGFTKSFRQTGPLPRLQIVLDDSNAFADVDLDVELHRSSPHDIFKDFTKRYPEVGNIFQY